MKRLIPIVCLLALCVAGCSNPSTPAGCVGYVTQGAILGKTCFYDLQTGPTSTGLGWLLEATNVSITPFTYLEEFSGEESVLSKDNLKISFRVHVVWRVKKDQVRDFVEKYSTLSQGSKPGEIEQVAFQHTLKETIRTYTRDEIQKLDGLDIKDQITPIGEAVLKRARVVSDPTPFEIMNIVVGNIQYPKEVADAVANKLATTQLLQQKQTEIKIEDAERQKRIIQAEGVAKAMEIIQVKLTTNYLQHEAIEAQKLMVNSQNHTTIYIPVGPMGVPVVGTTNLDSK